MSTEQDAEFEQDGEIELTPELEARRVRFVELRKLIGVQEVAAPKLGLSASTLSRKERGLIRVTIRDIALAEALAVDKSAAEAYRLGIVPRETPSDEPADELLDEVIGSLEHLDIAAARYRRRRDAKGPGPTLDRAREDIERYVRDTLAAGKAQPGPSFESIVESWTRYITGEPEPREAARNDPLQSDDGESVNRRKKQSGND